MLKKLKNWIKHFSIEANRKQVYLFIGLAAYIFLTLFLLSVEKYFILLTPLALLVVWAALFRLDWFLLFTVALIPLSIPLQDIIGKVGFDMSLPSEPLLAGIMLLFFIKLLYEKEFDNQILKHPVSLAVYFYLGWMFVTSATSTMPLISIKFSLAHTWFLVVFYLLCTQLFRKIANFRLYIWFYLVPLIVVIVYSLARHYHYGIFNKTIAYWACNPFYKDHTSYGAVLAFLIPTVIALLFFKEYSLKIRMVLLGISILLFVALVFSYTRAAWLGVVASFGIWLAIRLKIKFKFVVLIIIGGFFISWFAWTQLVVTMSQNKQDSSTNLSEHLQSISNIKNDASNLERLNRWSCAIRMFREKPLFGFGPGTYMFQYAPYQLSHEKTIISTNAGTMGNAHSEYLGPLAESGIFGFLSFLLVIVSTVYTSVKVIRINSGQSRAMAIAALLGLVTYYIHGVMNNFLDTDKVSALFWGFTAVIVAIDVYHKPKESST